jgi:hypothetical protein
LHGCRFTSLSLTARKEMTSMKDDLISRQAVLDEIHKYMEERDYTIGTLYDNICEMPSNQSEHFNPCTVCQEFDCTGCKFRRT